MTINLQIVTTQPRKQLTERFIEYLSKCRLRGVITEKQPNELTPPDNVSAQIIYFLLNAHTCKQPLKVRPIVLNKGKTYKRKTYST